MATGTSGLGSVVAGLIPWRVVAVDVNSLLMTLWNVYTQQLAPQDLEGCMLPSECLTVKSNGLFLSETVIVTFTNYYESNSSNLRVKLKCNKRGEMQEEVRIQLRGRESTSDSGVQAALQCICSVHPRLYTSILGYRHQPVGLKSAGVDCRGKSPVPYHQCY